MTATEGYTISPRDRIVRDIQREMHIMAMSDLASLYDHAVNLNARRLEAQYQDQHSITEDTHHAE
jgi:hypothetical protein